jgi:hypothetical protein
MESIQKGTFFDFADDLRVPFCIENSGIVRMVRAGCRGPETLPRGGRAYAAGA